MATEKASLLCFCGTNFARVLAWGCHNFIPVQMRGHWVDSAG